MSKTDKTQNEILDLSLELISIEKDIKRINKVLDSTRLKRILGNIVYNTLQDVKRELKIELSIVKDKLEKLGVS